MRAISDSEGVGRSKTFRYVVEEAAGRFLGQRKLGSKDYGAGRRSLIEQKLRCWSCPPKPALACANTCEKEGPPEQKPAAGFSVWG